MATVLKRPMFRIGGSADGTGITSGLRRYGSKTFFLASNIS